VFENEVGRRALLRGIGAVGVAGGATLLAPGAATAATRNPLDLRFRQTHKFRPFDLIAPRFVQYDSALTPPAARDTLISTDVRPRAPYGAVTVEVRQLSGGAVVAGFVGAGTSVLGVYDARSGQASIEVTVGGTTTVVKSAPATFAAPGQFAMVLNENAVTVLVDPTGTGTGWQPLITERAGVSALIDLRDPRVLGQLSYGYGGRGGDSAGTVLLGRVRAGYFGQAGVRDPHVVQHADGRPYVKDGKLYLTLTNAGLGFFQQAHWAVWTLDLADPTKLEQVAVLFFERDGVILGDHAGQIVVDSDGAGDRFILAMSSWGDFDFNGVHVRHAATDANVLSGVHVIATEQLPLPTDVSSWDPALTKVDGQWHVAFVESPAQQPAFVFHPALAVAPKGGDYTDATTLLGADLSTKQTEGTIIQRFGRDWYVLASDGDTRQYKVYDFAMTLLGTLDAPYGTNIPHPMIAPVKSGHWLLTFDGTQYAEPVLGYGGHGDFIVMRA
jgi:hypothetical protein